MTSADREPSPPASWQARLRDLLHDCAASGSGEEADRLDEAYRLFAAMTPTMSLPPRPQFAAMIAVRAWESAALSLLGSRAVYMLSRGANGNAMASVVDAHGREVTAEGASAALALLAARLASILSDLDEAAHRRPQSAVPIARPH